MWMPVRACVAMPEIPDIDYLNGNHNDVFPIRARFLSACSGSVNLGLRTPIKNNFGCSGTRLKCISLLTYFITGK